jgi:acetyl esterase/lipase
LNQLRLVPYFGGLDFCQRQNQRRERGGWVYSGGSMKLSFLLLAGLITPAWAGSGVRHAPPARLAAKAAVKPAAKIKAPAGSTRTIVLWPAGAPGALGKEDNDVPKMYEYPAAGPGVKSAVIVMPGGGYRNLMMEKEGAAEARWLSAHGVTAFVLEYRLGQRYQFPAPMQDGARAIRYVRSHAEELGVVRDKIGVCGFSAGGHLAGFLAAVHDKGDAKAADLIDRVSDRPDFAILSYARLSMDAAIPRDTNLEGLLGDHPTPEMLKTVSIDRLVTKDTSPCFVYSTTGDQTVNSMNATAFYDAMKRAGVPVELHIFERGAHGTGLGLNLQGLPELAIHSVLVENWMQAHGWMAVAKGGE